MALIEDIQSAIKSSKVILGYNESIKYIKTNKPKMVIVANNLPSTQKNEIANNLRVSKTKMEILDGTSVDLGVICGKPFPVSTLVIKG